MPAALAAAALLGGASAAGAQIKASDAWAPSCGPGTACTLLRFNFQNVGASTALFNTLSLSFLSSTFKFASAAGGVALYQAVDAIGPFGGAATVAPGGAQTFVDFLGGVGFAFELDPGTSGYVEVPLASAPLGTPYFSYTATLDGGGIVAGTTAPEPATAALLGGGLALAGLAARRRRRA